jgi:ribonucleoside-diphosphate reductase alpha chain
MDNNYFGFRNEFGLNTFNNKYAMARNDTWSLLSYRLVDCVTGYGDGLYHNPLMSKDERDRLQYFIDRKMFIPGGRYLYYVGRLLRAYNNCYLLRAEEDTREEWARLMHVATSCLMLGGGIGIDYSRLRASGSPLHRTGGTASGPLPLMDAVNELGRNVMQGGSRRSAIYASLGWNHEDVGNFLQTKNWSDAVRLGKEADFNFRAPLDMTNISVNYDDSCLEANGKWKDEAAEVFTRNCIQALSTGEPGFSFNFNGRELDSLRNACTEVTSEDDSDVCNLGSVNLGEINDIETFKEVVHLGSKFLVCGTIRAELPYQKVYDVRAKNRRLGLGLMGIHEWLLKRGSDYSVTPELHKWLSVYEKESKSAADAHCDRFYLNRPKAYRAIAPTGSIGILAGTTTGIEPLFAVAYKRRYLTEGTKWKYEYVVDSTADYMMREFGVDPDKIETTYSLSSTMEGWEKRIKFQYDIQKYVDMSISSTINLPRWGSDANNEDKVTDFASTLMQYAKGLRGFTCYPDGSRGGQPLTEVSLEEARKHKGMVLEETPDICEVTGHGGSCGV